MSKVTIIGIDLAKRVFHLHGARVDGSVAFRKKLSRPQLLAFFAQHPRCIVAMEACATAHGWGREFEKLGHDVRLIAPIYVKPFVKRQKKSKKGASLPLPFRGPERSGSNDAPLRILLPHRAAVAGLSKSTLPASAARMPPSINRLNRIRRSIESALPI